MKALAFSLRLDAGLAMARRTTGPINENGPSSGPSLR